MPLLQLCSLLLIALLAKFPAEAGYCPPTDGENTREDTLQLRRDYYSTLLRKDIAGNHWNSGIARDELGEWMFLARNNHYEALNAFDKMYERAEIAFNKGPSFLDALGWIVSLSGINAGVWKDLVDAVKAFKSGADSLKDKIGKDVNKVTTWKEASDEYHKHLNNQGEFKIYLINKFWLKWTNKGDPEVLVLCYSFITYLYRDHCPSKRQAFNKYYNQFQVTWLSQKAKGHGMMPRHIIMDDTLGWGRTTRFLWSPAPPGIDARTVARAVFKMNEHCIDGELLPLGMGKNAKFVPRIMTADTTGWWYEFPGCNSLNNYSHNYQNGREQRRTHFSRHAVNPTPFCDHARFKLGDWHYELSDLKTVPMYAWNYADNWLTPRNQGSRVYK